MDGDNDTTGDEQTTVRPLFPPPAAGNDVPAKVQLAAELYVRAMGSGHLGLPPVMAAANVLTRYFDAPDE